MSKPDRSRVMHFAEAQARIASPAVERAVMVLQRGTLDIAFGESGSVRRQSRL